MQRNSQTSELFMRRAIELSRQGFPAPNPHVGCVIVRDGEIIGEGYHTHAGAPHAEVAALNVVAGSAKGADVYVTLEPCNHVGRTGPCSEALIRAGVSKVIYACSDPNPKATGGGEKLKAAGIEVECGLLESQAREANLQFIRAMELKRPYVTVKAAMSLDGRIAVPSGESQWITGEDARMEGHKLRALCGCVLVGVGTALKDRPRLTARVDGVVNQPLRAVLDPEGVLHPDEPMFSQDPHWVQFVRQANRPGQFEVPFENGSFDLNAVLAALWSRGQTGVLVEGGAVAIGSFLKAKLVDRLELFVSGKILGSGANWASDLGVQVLSEAPEADITSARQVGKDAWISASLDRQRTVGDFCYTGRK